MTYCHINLFISFIAVVIAFAAIFISVIKNFFCAGYLAGVVSQSSWQKICNSIFISELFFKISVAKSFCSGLTIVKSLGLVDRRLIKRSAIFTNCLLNGFKNPFKLLFEVLGITDIVFVFAQSTRDDLILDKAKKNNALVRGNAGDEKNLHPAGRKFIFLTNLIEVLE